MRAHLRALTTAAAPIMSPAAVAAAVAIAATAFVAAFLQFLTPALEAAPWLAYALAAAVAAEALALAGAIAVRRTFERGQLLALAAAALAFVGATSVAGAKLQWQRGLDGNPYYTLPARPTRFPKDAIALELRAADGVALQATQLGGRRPHGVVIVPSWRTDRDGFAIATLATWLANDLDVVILDPRGQGGSGGAKSPDGAERLDVLAAVAALRATGHARVGVLAEQDGCHAATWAALERKGVVDALALIGPTARWGEALGPGWDPHGLPGRLYWRVAAGLRFAGGPPAPPLAEAVKKVAPVPLLVAGPRSDPGSVVDTLHLAAGEPKSLILFGGEGKPVAWSHYAAYYQAVSEWLALTLSEPRPSGSVPPPPGSGTPPPADVPGPEGQPTPAPEPGG